MTDPIDPTVTTVRRSVRLPVGPERAFALFTERFDDIKPHEHNLLGVPATTSTFEPVVGGHIVDRAPDGGECRWSRVLAVDPPHRLVFSWDITPQWELQTDPELTSEVEVSFTPDGDSGTLVSVTHRHLDRHGPGWESMRSALDGPDGWPRYLDNAEAATGSLSLG